MDSSFSSFDPVFDTLKCDVPEIPPISDSAFIDCFIPPEITPIFDCNDIDLPVPTSYIRSFLSVVSSGGGGGAGPVGDKGDPGNPGADGEDGADGCAPSVTPVVTVICVNNEEEIDIDIQISEVATCEYKIEYTFYVYCPFEKEDICCFWTWCPCDHEELKEPGEAEECGFETNYCGQILGKWVLQEAMSHASCPGTNPPCIVGDYHGQTRIICNNASCDEEE